MGLAVCCAARFFQVAKLIIIKYPCFVLRFLVIPTGDVCGVEKVVVIGSCLLRLFILISTLRWRGVRRWEFSETAFGRLWGGGSVVVIALLVRVGGKGVLGIGREGGRKALWGGGGGLRGLEWDWEGVVGCYLF